MPLKWWQRARFYTESIRARSPIRMATGIVDPRRWSTAHLDYLNWAAADSLGIDAIWLNPINPSPSADWGYE